MTSTKTFANPSVLEFYKELPFNYSESVEQQAEAVRVRDSVLAYPVLADLLKPKTHVVEVGCGAGWLSNSIAYHYGSNVTAIDFNPIAIERAQAVAKVLDIAPNFKVADLFLYRPETPADIAVSVGVLHHTDDCHAAVRRVLSDYVRPGGYGFVGLYHTYGRRPFLQYFVDMENAGASEDEMFERYWEMMPQATDQVHARSWFRDQVLHPHETQHTLAEMLPIIEDCEADLVSTSINRFESIDSLDDVLSQEAGYEETGKQWLAEGRYFPGFFVFLVKKRG